MKKAQVTSAALPTKSEIKNAVGIVLGRLPKPFSKRLTASAFKAACKDCLSILSVEGSVELDGLASAIREEQQALLRARHAATASEVDSYLISVGDYKTTLTPTGSEQRQSTVRGMESTTRQTILKLREVIDKLATQVEGETEERASIRRSRRHHYQTRLAAISKAYAVILAAEIASDKATAGAQANAQAAAAAQAAQAFILARAERATKLAAKRKAVEAMATVAA